MTNYTFEQWKECINRFDAIFDHGREGDAILFQCKEVVRNLATDCCSEEELREQYECDPDPYDAWKEGWLRP